MCSLKRVVVLVNSMQRSMASDPDTLGQTDTDISGESEFSESTAQGNTEQRGAFPAVHMLE